MVVKRIASTAAWTLFLALGFVSAQEPSATPQPSTAAAQQKEPEPCTVSGRVLSAAEGAPLRSARVGLIQADIHQHPAVYGTTTDDQGHFEIKKVPPGRYRFVASHTGFVSQEYQSKGTTGGAVLALSSGQTIDDAMFRLVRAAVISGRVLDEAGQPMQGVYISALRKQTADEREEAGRRSKRDPMMQAAGNITDDRGEYRIFGLKPGEYFLKATESPDEAMGFMSGTEVEGDNYFLTREMGAQYAPLYYPGVLQPGDAEPLQLRVGEEVQADFAMRHIKTVRVSGHVIAADGKPATHAFVSLRTQNVNDYVSGPYTSTDEKGEFVIKGVVPGTYIIDAQQHSPERRDFAHQKLDVGESNLDNVVLSFGSGVTLSGRITAAGAGAALDRAHVMLTPLDDEGAGLGGWAEVKPDGTFEMTNVADGSYILRAGVSQKGWYVKSARLGATDVMQKGVQIEHGAVPGSLEIVLSSQGAQLDGTVMQDNKPVVGAHIRLRPDPETPYNEMRGTAGTSDQNGQFTIQTVPPGRYKVVAKLPSGTPEVPSLSSEPQVITLGEHDHQSVQLTLPKPGE